MDPSHQGSVLIQTLFFLRFIQQGSLVLTGFVAIYFVWWHNRLEDKVPRELVLLITTCSLTFIENYTSTALSIYRREVKPNHILLFKTSIPCSFGMLIAYYSLRQIPFIRTWCEGDNWFAPVSRGRNSNIEQHHCALTCTIIAAGAVALLFTFLISIFTCIAWCLSERKEGYTVLEAVIDDEYTDELIRGGDLIDVNSEKI
ncbi:hypothetical protein B0O99DRAFT_686847 [Bisporella sp. PMI_857]|nr:hypothetical protein B0O99DRAFT_686847 [Bisporella sp. PMI_857]